MRFLRLRRPSPALAIAVLALVVALGGSAYAVRQINGATIKIRSIPGNRIANNALTGTQINEARLARVNEARNATNSKFALRASAADSAANALNAGSARSADTLAGSPPTAFQGRIRWALVNSAGTVIDQSGGIASPAAHTINSPTYVIDFGADLSHKALLVTPNGAAAQPTSAQVNDATHAQVTVGTSGGSFYIAVVG
ncbi:MAG: hypothetical protein QOH11_2845 [Solirubrobacteraceae bacterium]|jgi:hypothetical protein|nr:hypothetical protein [Solirubrobacteraceae bacterium]